MPIIIFGFVITLNSNFLLEKINCSVCFLTFLYTIMFAILTLIDLYNTLELSFLCRYVLMKADGMFFREYTERLEPLTNNYMNIIKLQYKLKFTKILKTYPSQQTIVATVKSLSEVIYSHACKNPQLLSAWHILNICNLNKPLVLLT